MPIEVKRLEELESVDLREGILSLFRENRGMAFTYHEIQMRVLGSLNEGFSASPPLANTFYNFLDDIIDRSVVLAPVMNELVSEGNLRVKVCVREKKSLLTVQKERLIYYYAG